MKFKSTSTTSNFRTFWTWHFSTLWDSQRGDSTAMPQVLHDLEQRLKLHLKSWLQTVTFMERFSKLDFVLSHSAPKTKPTKVDKKTPYFFKSKLLQPVGSSSVHSIQKRRMGSRPSVGLANAVDHGGRPYHQKGHVT